MALLALCVGSGTLLSCGSDDDVQGGSGSGLPGADGGAVPFDAGVIPGFDAAIVPGQDAGAGPQPIPGACGGNRYDAQPKQLDVYMALDESGSMIPWWFPVTGALNSFLNAPEAAGIGMGLTLFGENCDPGFYATPKVSIAALPGNAAAITGAFPILPTSGTATLPALKGAIQHARSWQMSHPESKVVVLLVTDGLPQECGSNVQNVAQAAAEGFNGNPSIPTYVIGLPLLEPLNPIAVAGGTQRAFAADPTNSQALIAAMNQVRGQALPCDYALPENATDPSLVNLDYTAQGAESKRLPRVQERSRCAGVEGGWYYDDPASPKRIVACEQTCSALKQGGGKLDVIVGCPTVVLN